MESETAASEEAEQDEYEKFAFEYGDVTISVLTTYDATSIACSSRRNPDDFISHGRFVHSDERHNTAMQVALTALQSAR